MYIDNNNALAALIRGDINAADAADMVAVFWSALVSLGIDARLGRVGSKLNIADVPTGDKPSLRTGCSRGGNRMSSLLYLQ